MCFSNPVHLSCFPWTKSSYPNNQLNMHHVPSKKFFTDSKYLLPLRSYGNFLTLLYLTMIIQWALELKKTTREDYYYLQYCVMDF